MTRSRRERFDRHPISAWLYVGLFGVACTSAQDLSATAVEDEIKNRGAATVLRRLYEEPERWSAVLEAITRGEPGWISVAAKLHTASDAGSSEELNLAVADALEREPKEVLAVLEGPFEVNMLCGNAESVGERYEAAVAILERRTSAVQAVKGESPQKKACLEALQHLTNAIHENRSEWFRE